MRAVVQRVTRASVKIGGTVKSEISHGLLIFIGIEGADDKSDIDYLSAKIVQLRIFNDNAGIMNLSVAETGGSILAVSQFTLHARTKKGNRPSYIKAANPAIAIPLYDLFIEKLNELMPGKIATGEFGAMMEIELVNDGPVTILIDTKLKE